METAVAALIDEYEKLRQPLMIAVHVVVPSHGSV